MGCKCDWCQDGLNHETICANKCGEVLGEIWEFERAETNTICQRCQMPFDSINTKCPEDHKVDTSSCVVY